MRKNKGEDEEKCTIDKYIARRNERYVVSRT